MKNQFVRVSLGAMCDLYFNKVFQIISIPWLVSSWGGGWGVRGGGERRVQGERLLQPGQSILLSILQSDRHTQTTGGPQAFQSLSVMRHQPPCRLLGTESPLPTDTWDAMATPEHPCGCILQPWWARVPRPPRPFRPVPSRSEGAGSRKRRCGQDVSAAFQDPRAGAHSRGN